MARGLTLLFALAATAAQGRSRTVVIPAPEIAGAHFVEVRVALREPTTLYLPSPITGGGFVVNGAPVRLSLLRVGPAALAIYPLEGLGPEPVSLLITTDDRRAYWFSLVPDAESPDEEVTVALGWPPEEREKPISEADLHRATVEMLLRVQTPYVRHYRPVPTVRGDMREDWVGIRLQMAMRREGRFYLQVASRSRGPWMVKQVLVEGTDGKALEVEDIVNQAVESNGTLTVITAKVPAGVGADYALSSIRLVGADSRLAILAGEVLP